MIPSPEEQPTMTVEEAAKACGISRSSAYAAVRSGDLPAIRIGRRTVVPTAALRHLLGFEPAVAAPSSERADA